MLELGSDLGLLHEPMDHCGGPLVPLPEHLDGHVTTQVGVPALEHHAHASLGDLARDLVSLPQVKRRGLFGQRVDHRCMVLRCGPQEDLGHVIAEGLEHRQDAVSHLQSAVKAGLEPLLQEPVQILVRVVGHGDHLQEVWLSLQVGRD